MRFFTSFSAQHERLFIGLVMGTEIFEFRPYLCLWQPFKEGTRQAIRNVCHLFSKLAGCVCKTLVEASLSM